MYPFFIKKEVNFELTRAQRTLLSTFEQAIGRKRLTSFRLFWSLGMSVMIATWYDEGIKPSLRIRQVMKNRRSAQQGSFLYTRYGRPLGPGADLLDLFLRNLKNLDLDGED